jgi:hypothetical protein
MRDTQNERSWTLVADAYYPSCLGAKIGRTAVPGQPRQNTFERPTPINVPPISKKKKSCVWWCTAVIPVILRST